MLFVHACFPHPLPIGEVSGKYIRAVDDMSAELGYNDPSGVTASTSLFVNIAAVSMILIFYNQLHLSLVDCKTMILLKYNWGRNWMQLHSFHHVAQWWKFQIPKCFFSFDFMQMLTHIIMNFFIFAIRSLTVVCCSEFASKYHISS